MVLQTLSSGGYIIDWTAVAALATVAAVVTALAAPYLAAHIQSRRRSEAAMQLAEMALKAIRLRWEHADGRATRERLEAWSRETFELNLEAILEAMSRVPPDHLGKAAALEAFLRLQGVGRSALEMQKLGEGLRD